MDASPDVAGRIERRLDALGLRPEQVDATVGLPLKTTECLQRGVGFLPGGRFLPGLCAVLDTNEEYLLGLEPGDLGQHLIGWQTSRSATVIERPAFG